MELTKDKKQLLIIDKAEEENAQNYIETDLKTIIDKYSVFYGNIYKKDIEEHKKIITLAYNNTYTDIKRYYISLLNNGVINKETQIKYTTATRLLRAYFISDLFKAIIDLNYITNIKKETDKAWAIFKDKKSIDFIDTCIDINTFFNSEYIYFCIAVAKTYKENLNPQDKQFGKTLDNYTKEIKTDFATIYKLTTTENFINTFNKLLVYLNYYANDKDNDITQTQNGYLSYISKLYRTSPQAIEERNILKKYDNKDLTQNREITKEKGEYITITIPPIQYMRKESTEENLNNSKNYKGYDFLLCEEIDKHIFNFIINQKLVRAIYQYKEDKKKAEKENKQFIINNDYERIIKRCENGKITNSEILSLFDKKSQEQIAIEKQYNIKYDLHINYKNYGSNKNITRLYNKFDINLLYMRSILAQEKNNINGYEIKTDYPKIKDRYLIKTPTQKKVFVLHISDEYKKACIIDYFKNNFATSSNIKQIAIDTIGAEKKFKENTIKLFLKLEQIFEAEHKRKIENRAIALHTTTQNIIDTEYYKDFNFNTFYNACIEIKILTKKEESQVKELQKMYNSLNLLKDENYIKDFILIKKEDIPKEHKKTFEELKEKTLFNIKDNGNLSPISKQIDLENTKILIKYTPQLEIEKNYKIKDYTSIENKQDT